jgi:hypothetical protein
MLIFSIYDFTITPAGRPGLVCIMNHKNGLAIHPGKSGFLIKGARETKEFVYSSHDANSWRYRDKETFNTYLVTIRHQIVIS